MNNKERGFFGTVQRNYSFSDAKTARVFENTATLLKQHIDVTMEQIVNFLDGRYGRHFADELSFHGATEKMSEDQFLNMVKKFLNLNQNSWIIHQVEKKEHYANYSG